MAKAIGMIEFIGNFFYTSLDRGMDVDAELAFCGRSDQLSLKDGRAFLHARNGGNADVLREENLDRFGLHNGFFVHGRGLIVFCETESCGKSLDGNAAEIDRGTDVTQRNILRRLYARRAELSLEGVEQHTGRKSLTAGERLAKSATTAEQSVNDRLRIGRCVV